MSQEAKQTLEDSAWCHTLDKNGSLYDPAGTESWNMQIRYETMKLPMHPTNNRSSPEWSSGSESTSKRINKPAIISSAMSRRSLDNRYCRRRCCRRSCKRVVTSMLSTPLLRGRFWCSETNRKWPKLIPDCDNSAATRQLVQQFKPDSAGTQSWSDSASSTSG